MISTAEKAPEHLRFAVLATDVALFTIRDGELLVRLIPVNRSPQFINSRGLPGGLIRPEETAEETALRLVHEKAKITSKDLYMEQLYTFSALKRDPRGRVVAVAYLGLIPWQRMSATEQADTEESWWATIPKAKKLAYDHDEILAVAVNRLRSRVTYTSIISKLLPKEFTLTELEEAYESILGKNLDKRNFRKKILKLNIVSPLGRKRAGGRFRPAELYAFTSNKVVDIEIL